MAKITVTYEYDPEKLKDGAYAALLQEHMHTLVKFEIQKALNAVPQVEQKIKAFEDIATLPPEVIQHILRNISKDKLVKAMKGADRAFIKAVEENLSVESFKLLMMDMSAYYLLRVRDIDAAQNEILKIVNEYYSDLESE